jgi:hypothetical protein
MADCMTMHDVGDLVGQHDSHLVVCEAVEQGVPQDHAPAGTEADGFRGKALAEADLIESATIQGAASFVEEALADRVRALVY